MPSQALSKANTARETYLYDMATAAKGIVRTMLHGREAYAVRG